MKVIVTSIFVDDQEKAKTFYSEKLGFEVKHDIDMGGGHKWLTVVSKEQENGTEICIRAK